MKTSILIDIAEQIFGLTITPATTHKGTPTPEERALWKSIVGTQSNLNPSFYGIDLTPKDGQPDDLAWFQTMTDRILRISANRPPCLSTVKVKKAFPNGTPRVIQVTVNPERDNPNRLCPAVVENGTWTLYEIPAQGKRRKILKTVTAPLDCFGDELYSHLPDGDIPEGYDSFPDGPEVWVGPAAEPLDSNRVTWIFTFKPEGKRSLSARLKANASAEWLSLVQSCKP